MKIAYLTWKPIPSVAAHSVQIVRMCEAFAQLGHDVELFAARPDLQTGDDFNYYGVSRCFRIARRNCLPVRIMGPVLHALMAAKKYARNGKADLVYTRDPINGAFAAAGNTPIVHEIHELPRGIKAFLEHWILTRSTVRRVVVISNSLKAAYCARFGDIAEKKIIVAPSAAALSPNHSTSSIQLCKRTGALQVAYLGHLYEGRGIGRIAELARQVPDIDFHMIGGEADSVARWRAATADAGNLHFYGHRPPAESAATLAAVDILLAPYQNTVRTRAGTDSSRWMSPLKVFEYMAAGKPILCSDLPVLKELFEDGKNALLVPADNPDAWVRGLERLRDPRLRERLGRCARADFEVRYTWRIRAECVLEGIRPFG